MRISAAVQAQVKSAIGGDRGAARAVAYAALPLVQEYIEEALLELDPALIGVAVARKQEVVALALGRLIRVDELKIWQRDDWSHRHVRTIVVTCLRSLLRDDGITPSLINAALRGDKPAQAVIFPHLNALFRKALARARVPMDAREDLVQELTYRYLVEDGGRRIREWRPERGASLTTWISKASVWYVRRSARRDMSRARAADDAVERSTGSMEVEVEVRDLVSRVTDWISCLPADEQRLVALKLTGEETRDIAEKLGKSSSNVDVTFHRIMRKIRHAFGRISGGEA